MKKSKMQYHVFYVEGCIPKIKPLETKKRVDQFLKQFVNKYGSLDDKGDNWIDQIFYGQLLKIESIFKLKK